MAYSTPITKKLIPEFMEDMAKVIADKSKDNEIGQLEKILEVPYIKEPQEVRSA